MTNGEYQEIKIPKNLLDKIGQRIKDTEFKSVDEYIVFVLEEVVNDDYEEEHESSSSEEDEEKVKDRLKALGYLG